jgi:uncharacterized protein (TIGR02646 family)
MRYIHKIEEPQSFSEWKAIESQTPNCTYGNFKNPQKRELHEALLKEQGYLCCYCEIRIARQDSHIEHVWSQGLYPSLSLDYSNLLASCQGENSPPLKKPIHCGQKKDNELLKVSPLIPDCAKFFRYTEAGEILSAQNRDEEAANSAIDILGLNIDKLKRLRKSAIDGLDINGLTQAEVQQFIQGIRQLNANGQHDEFFSAILYVLGQYA